MESGVIYCDGEFWGRNRCGEMGGGLVGGNQELCCKHVKFEMSIQHSNRGDKLEVVFTFCEPWEKICGA